MENMMDSFNIKDKHDGTQDVRSARATQKNKNDVK